MTTLTLQLPVSQAEQLAALARRLRTTSEDLATAKILQFLEEQDAQLERDANDAREKGRGPYRRPA